MQAFRVRPVLIAAAALLAAASADAQKEKRASLPTPVPQPLLQKLQPNGEQDAKLRAARRAWEDEMARIKEQAAKEELKQSLGAANAAYQGVLEKTLTPGQREQLFALCEEAEQFRALGEIGFHLAAMDLSPAQKGKIRESVAKHQPEIERLGAAAKVDKDEAAARQAAELRRKLLEEVTAVLTPEQRQALPPKKTK